MNRTLALPFFCALLAACAGAHEARTDEPAVVPSSFSHEGEAPLVADWWTAFDDPELSAAIDTALSQNFGLRGAWERIRAAEAIVRRTRGGRRPSVDATGSAGYGPSAFESDGWRASVGVQASYEIDLWGRIGAGVQAETLRAEAIAADFQAAAISVAAETTTTWLELAAQDETLALIDAQIEVNETMLRLLERRFGGGAGNTSEVLRQRALVAATVQEREVAQAQRNATEHALSMLLGTPNDDRAMRRKTLPMLPAFPDAGVPTDVVTRRPDVQQALLQLEAAERDVAVAAAERLPRLTLTASLNSGVSGAEQIFREWALGVAGGILAPLFRGGALRAEHERAEAVRDERWYAYGEAILAALVDVETALALEQGEAQRLVQIEARIGLLEASLEQLQHQYLNGAGDYIDVLTAQRELQQLQRDVISARRDQLAYRVALYRSVAGPVDVPEQPLSEDP